MITKPKNVDKWGVIVKVDMVEEPPFVDSADVKMLNTIKVQFIKTNDPTIVVCVCESLTRLRHVISLRLQTLALYRRKR